MKRCPTGFEYIIKGNLNEFLSASQSYYFYNNAEKVNNYIDCRKYNFCASQNKYYLIGDYYDFNLLNSHNFAFDIS